MWKVASCKKTGKYHLDHFMECQDQVFSKEKEHYQVIVLADGMGESNANVGCVFEIVEYTADALLKMAEADKIMELGNDMIVCNLMNGIIHIISHHMDEKHMPAEMFGSTLLAVFMDHKSDKYLLVHLGDGIIIARDDRQVRVLSYPENKGSNSTFLTISENILDRMKIRRGRIGNLRQIVLCSDGVYSYPPDKEFTEHKIWQLLNGQEPFAIREDDQSYIQVRRDEDGLLSGDSWGRNPKTGGDSG